MISNGSVGDFTISLPDDTPWYGWVTLFAVVGLCFFGYILWSMRRKTNSTEQTVKSVHEQVANTHDTNLREDIDKIQAAVDAAIGPIVEITKTLQRVETKVEVTATAVEYLSSDARQTRRDIGDLRADRRIDSEKIDRISEQFADHLGKEA